MTYHIFVRTCAPNTVRYLEEETYENRSDAAMVADLKQRNSDLAEFMVVDHKLVHAAYEEAFCYFTEHAMSTDDEERFDAKWMEYIERFASLHALAAMALIFVAVEF